MGAPWRAVALAAGLLAILAQPGAAQAVQGQLVDADTGEPVEGALVLLLRESGEEVGGYLTNQAGRFVIRAPGRGVYTLRAERIGYETTSSDPLTLGTSMLSGIQLQAATTAIELAEIRVEGDQRCVVRPEEGLQLARVWDEARKALTVQDWTERKGAYRFQVTRYERELDVLARTVLSETRETNTGVSSSPIRSLPAEDLIENGFVRPASDGGYNYYGPDASVLLSDAFLDTHCFRLVLDEERSDEVGLGFQPVQSGGTPDIAGTLWMEAETARLKVLEYSYTWAPWAVARGAARGEVHFENLPTGAWVVSNWWIRMPIAEMDMSMARMRSDEGIRLTGLKEVGGGIAGYTSLDLAQVFESSRGVLNGQVWDSTRQTPLPGATVFLSGTQYSAETDADGAFLMSDLPRGTFSVAFTHPRLDSLGAFSQAVPVTITPGEFSTVNLAIPAAAGIMISTCTEEELAERRGAVIGFVRESNGQVPVEGASVVIRWSTFHDLGRGTFRERVMGLETTSDATGQYSACGVPLNTSLTLQATHGARETEPVQVMSNRDGYTVVNLVFQSWEASPIPSDSGEALKPPSG
jgi:hypothetical protein